MSVIWGAFPHDPRDPANASLRASDADRDVVATALADAFADGRLDRAEYDDRSDTLTASRTLGELPPLLADLVSTRTPATRPPVAPILAADQIHARAVVAYERDRREAVLEFLGPSVVCVVIWAVVMFGGFFWPAFVLVGTGINLARVLVRRSDIVADHERSLERRQAKELRKRELSDHPPPAIGPTEPQG